MVDTMMIDRYLMNVSNFLARPATSNTLTLFLLHHRFTKNCAFSIHTDSHLTPTIILLCTHANSSVGAKEDNTPLTITTQ